MGRRSVQQVFAFEPRLHNRRRRGTRRGRQARPDRLGFVAHLPRPAHDRRHPVHVSMRRVAAAPSLRSERLYKAIVGQVAEAVRRGIRIIDYSVQNDHLHLIVEADSRQRLARGMQLLFSRIAMAVNAVAQRSGRLFRDRHHRRALTTPTEVRRAMVYVLFNTRKHDATRIETMIQELSWLDERSSVVWFDGWAEGARPPPSLVAAVRARAGPCPLTKPRTWLAAVGWKRGGGPLRFDETPRLPKW